MSFLGMADIDGRNGIAAARVDSWMTGESAPPLGLKYLVDRYKTLAEGDSVENDNQMNLIYDCLVRFIAR